MARWRDEQGAVAGIFKDRSEAYGDAVGRAITGVQELLERRRRDGKVRRCHGDLRLANICLLDGRVTLFDAIEFSEELSRIDVIYDLAFVLMDLHHRGLSDLGNIVFNRYLDITGDVDGLPLVPVSCRSAPRCAVRCSPRRPCAGPSRSDRAWPPRRDPISRWRWPGCASGLLG